MTKLPSFMGITVLVFFFLAAPASADWKDDIGYTQLVNELGVSMPTGNGITVSQVEALENDVNYLPNTSLSEFSGKVFTIESGASGISSHATTVGRYLYGSSTGIAGGIAAIDNWEADWWLTNATSAGFLKTGTNSQPGVESRDVQNHSWIGSFENDADKAIATDAIRCFDYTINRDNYVAVVGVSNGNSTTIPDLLAHSYNAITVGRSDGLHSHGLTTFDGAGRVKPEIVAPLSATSYAAPVVGSAAALLLETARGGNGSLVNVDHSEAIKALLLAGATKSEFPTWDRTHTRPLDDVYGAGELNVHQSYNILTAGEQEGGGSSLIGLKGWDYDTTLDSSSMYFFEVPDNNILGDMSVILAWNRIITDGINGPFWGDPQSSLANLDLKLWSATDFSLGALLDYSISTVDNVEHIYAQNLTAGRYALEVVSLAAGTNYALAWNGGALLAVPEPGSLVLLVLAGLCWFGHRRRRTSTSL